MEQFFEGVVQGMEGYEEFRKEVWGFKVCYIVIIFQKILAQMIF